MTWFEERCAPAAIAGRRGVAGAAIVLSLSVALAACSATTGAESSRNIVEHEKAVLGDAILAAYLSPQTYEWSETNDKGYVVLVDRDGGYRSIETSGMDANQMVWDRDGLHFSDIDRDYLLNESGLRSTESSKTDYQMSMHVIGGRAVSVYNVGEYKKRSYRMSVVEHDGERSSSTQAEGLLTGFARCGESVYATGQATGSMLKKYASSIKPSQGQKILTRLWPGSQEVVAAADVSPDDIEYFADAPCVDGTIYYLATSEFGKRQSNGVRRDRAILVGWSTRTGDRIENFLQTDRGEFINGGAIEFAYYGAESARDGLLTWADGRGVVYQTELANGNTREVLRVADVANNSDGIRVAQVGDALYVVELPHGDNSEFVLTKHHLSADISKELARLGGDFMENSQAVLRDVEVNPELIQMD